MLLRAIGRRRRPLWLASPRGILAVAPHQPGTTSAPPRSATRATPSSQALLAPSQGAALALTYYGGEWLRRVVVTPLGPRQLWERRVGKQTTVLGRLGGAALCRAGDLFVAVRLSTGEEKWRLHAPADLTCAPHLLPDGDLLLEFAGSWMRVRPVSGKRRDGGDSSRTLRPLRASARPLDDLAALSAYEVDHARVERDGDATIVAEPTHPPLRIEADGTLFVLGKRLGRL